MSRIQKHVIHEIPAHNLVSGQVEEPKTKC